MTTGEPVGTTTVDVPVDPVSLPADPAPWWACADTDRLEVVGPGRESGAGGGDGGDGPTGPARPGAEPADTAHRGGR